MSRIRSTVRGAVMLAAVAALCAGCGSASDLADAPAPTSASASDPSPGPSPDPTADPTDPPTTADPTDEPTTEPTEPTTEPTGTEAPEVGSCHGARPDEISFGSLYVGVRRGSCDAVHRSQTYLAERARGRVADALVDGDAETLEDLVRPTCIGALRRWTGASSQLRMARSQVVAWVVTPTGEQVADGARWVSCEASVRGGDGTAVALRDDTEGLLAGDGPSPYDTCVRGSLDAVPVVAVPCAKGHRYRAVEAISLGGPEDAYPGGRVLARTLRDACRRPVARYLGVEGSFRFGWTFPRRENWEDGRRAGVCLVPTDD